MKKIKLMKLDKRATMPKFAKQGDSGFDMYTLEDTIIKAGETKLIKTGIAADLEEGYEIQVRPRSGVSLNGMKGCYKSATNYDYSNNANGITLSSSPILNKFIFISPYSKYFNISKSSIKVAFSFSLNQLIGIDFLSLFFINSFILLLCTKYISFNSLNSII